MKTSSNVAVKFRTLADGMQADIDHCFANRLSNTPKRQREAATARMNGTHLQRTQEALRAIADAVDAGTLASCLASLKSKSEVHALMRSHIDRSNAGYYDAGFDTNKPATDTEQTRALWAIVAGQSEAHRKAEELRRKIEGLQFANIPGYFPTPPDVVARMIEAAHIPERECMVLEPSAGSGAIADAIREAAPRARLECVERQYTLVEILGAKGHTAASRDFLQILPTGTYDRVLMNPPFENGQDMAHVRHAFSFLKPGGRLVSIMSPSPFFGANNKAAQFREWFALHRGEYIDLGAGAFKASGTGVATVMVTIDA